jgi:hypothetical protein
MFNGEIISNCESQQTFKRTNNPDKNPVGFEIVIITAVEIGKISWAKCWWALKA